MKTPEEIMQGLERCNSTHYDACPGCPYKSECDSVFSCIRRKSEDTIAYIQQIEADNASKDERIQMLEVGMEQWHDVAASPGAVEDMARENYRLTQELESVKRGRDAAVSFLHGDCGVCMFQQTAKCDSCRYGVNPFYEHDYWEWEGVCPENTEVQDEN